MTTTANVSNYIDREGRCRRRLEWMATTNIEIDTDLLARLRERHPGKDDRSLIEDMARIELGFAAVRDAQKRNALSEDEAIELGVRAVHEARRASA